MEGKLTSARTLDEVYAAVRAAARPSISSLVFRILIMARVMLANAALRLIRLLLFRWNGYRSTEFRRVVVYTAGILGDNVVMLPAIVALRRRYPGATLTIITNCQGSAAQPVVDLWRGAGVADSFHLVDDALVRHHGLKFWVDENQLAGVTCDLFVNLSPFGNRGWLGAVVREIALAKLLGATHAVGFGVSTWQIGGMLRRVQQYFIQNEPRRASAVLRELGLMPVSGDLLGHDRQARQSVLAKLAINTESNQILTVIHPGAKLTVKCWPADRFGAVAARLVDRYGAAVAVTGTADESTAIQTVVDASKGMAVGLTGNTTLAELIELLRRAAIVVTNDTGTMHLAALVGTPTVAIFGTRLTPTHWFPNHEKVIALFKLLECSYCHRDGDCDHLSCLRDITVDDVWQAITQLLDAQAATQRQRQTLPQSQLAGCATAVGGGTETGAGIAIQAVTKHRFSILIPVRNGETYLAQALDSALAQTRPADEIVVLDDASQDNSATIAKSPRWGGRVRYEYNAKPTGFADAFNRAAAMGTGDYITILHQDDLLDADYVSHIEQAVLHYPNVKHIYAACRYIDAAGQIIRTPPQPHSLQPVLYSGREYAHRYLMGVLANHHVHRCPGVTTSRQLLTQQCVYRKEAGHITDDDFFYRVGAFTDVIGISQPLASFREHHESATGQLTSAYLQFADDYLFQVRQNCNGATLLSHEDVILVQRMAVKMINQLLCYGLRQRNGDWINHAVGLRADLESLAPGVMELALPAWAKPLWRMTDGSMKGHLAWGYLRLLDAGLQARRLIRPSANKA